MRRLCSKIENAGINEYYEAHLVGKNANENFVVTFNDHSDEVTVYGNIDGKNFCRECSGYYLETVAEELGLKLYTFIVTAASYEELVAIKLAE